MKREPLVLAFALVFPGVMAWLYFVVVSPPMDLAGKPNFWMQMLYVAGKIVQFATPLLWLRLVDRNALLNLSPRAINPTAGLDAKYVEGTRWGVAVGVLMAALVFMLYMGLRNSQVLNGVPVQIRDKLGQFNALTPLRYAGLCAFLAVVNSGFEEYYWRWFVFGRLCKFMPPILAGVVSSLGFMAHHVIVLSVYFPGRFATAVVPFSLGIALGGAVWAWIYHKSGSLAGPWLSHFLVDTAILAFGYDLAFRQ